MKRVIGTVLAAVFCVCAPWSAAEDKWTRLVEEAGTVLGEIQEMPDQGIPEDLLKNCEGIAIFPSTISGGFVIGGEYGQGILMVRDEKTGAWSSPAVFNLIGGSFGWQIGGQATDVVLLVMNRRSIDGILQGKFKLGADAAVSAGPVGRNAQAATDVQLKGGILSYSRSRGLFAGAKLEGAVVAANAEGNSALYGNDLSAEDIVLDKKAPMPKSASGVLGVLKKYPH
ncbi:MAG: lipid-binding SYLF domain-containing protein [Candidatus Omnitrophica bacterium]|nr:lipid-binding SYLF domain-containing protein [Candidatus Omnitrophota bacterium]